MKFIKKYRKKIINFILIISVILVPGILLRVNYNIKINRGYSALYLFKRIDFNKVGTLEAEYLTRGWDIIDRFSAKSTRYSMNKEDRVNILNDNFKLARLFGRGLYDVLIIGILETALNPNVIAKPYGEVGMFGQWYSTARYYYNIARDNMPEKYFRAVKFNFTKKQDLLIPGNALRMAYIWLWIEERNYDGTELWTISGYRWGRFLSQHYARNDCNMFPVRFIIMTRFGLKKYNPRAYYWTWRNMRDCFERGDLDAGLKIYNKYKRKQDKLKTEQVEFRRLYRRFKDQEKIIKDMRALNILLRDKLAEYDKVEAGKIKVLKTISKEAKATGWEAQFKKLKDKAKSWLKK